MAKKQWPGKSYVDENGKKDTSISRISANNLNVEGLSIGSYDYVSSYMESNSIRTYYTKKYNFSSPDKLHYYIDLAGNINVVAYDQTVVLGGYKGNKKLVINTYDRNMKLLNQRLVNLPYDIWGGFYQGKDGNFYVVCVRKNKECNEGKSVIKVLKYTSSWNLVGSTDIYGSASNIYKGIQEPFHAGLPHGHA